MIVNDKSVAMALESVVTYFKTRLGVNDRTKKTIEVVIMPDTLYRSDRLLPGAKSYVCTAVSPDCVRLEVAY
jgi:hypothetical protein